MKHLLKQISLMLLFTAITQSSFAWGMTGHRVVAEIAQRHLTKKTQDNLKELLDNEPLDYWANWVDFKKSDTSEKWKERHDWHFVDVPGHLSKQDFIAYLKNVQQKNLYSQIPEMEKELVDKNLPLEQRKEALRFLIHLIGDLHQPLHSGGHEEDAGGNKIEEYWFGKKTNLHTIWDSELVDYQKWSYTEYATNIDVVNKDQIKKIQSGTLDDWFYECYQLANKVYDETPADTHLGYEYNYIFYDSLNQQLLDGGLRLAKVLNDIFGN